MSKSRPIASAALILVMLLAACTTRLPASPTTLPPAEAPSSAQAASPAPVTPAQALSPTPLQPEATSPPSAAPSTTLSPSATPAAPAAVAGTPARLAITLANAANLQTVNQVSQAGAKNLAWLPDNQSLALNTGQQVTFFNLQALKTTGNASAAATLLRASPDQQVVAWAAKDNTIHLWNVADQKEIRAFSGFTATVTSLAFSPGNRTLAASTFDSTLRIWDPASGQLLNTQKFPYWLADLAYSPDGKLLAGVDLPNFTAHIYDAGSGKETRTLAWNQDAIPALSGAFFSPDWKTLAWVARGTVQLMDVASGSLGPSLDHEDYVNAVTWSPDGKLLGAAAAATVNGNLSPAVLVWDAVAGKVLKVLPQPDAALDLAFSPNGQTLATLANNGAVQLWAVPR